MYRRTYRYIALFAELSVDLSARRAHKWRVVSVTRSYHAGGKRLDRFDIHIYSENDPHISVMSGMIGRVAVVPDDQFFAVDALFCSQICTWVCFI